MSRSHDTTNTRFRASDRIDVPDHARRRWRQRAFDGAPPAYTAAEGWRRSRDRAVPWGLFNALYVRYDSQTDCLLIAVNHHTGSRARLILLTVVRAQWELERPAVKRVVNRALDEDREAIADDIGGSLEVLA